MSGAQNMLGLSKAASDWPFGSIVRGRAGKGFGSKGFCRGRGGGWWARKDLNLGPMDYESTALTAELRARFSTYRMQRPLERRKQFAARVSRFLFYRTTRGQREGGFEAGGSEGDLAEADGGGVEDGVTDGSGGEGYGGFSRAGGFSGR